MNANKPMYGRLHENHTPLPGLMETTRTSKATQQKRAETPKTKPYYSQTVSWQTGNWCLLLDDTKTTQPTPQGSDPSAFQYLPAPTDRQRKAQVPSIAEMHIQALYWQIIGSQWIIIPSTLDPTPTHISSTATSSSWVSFLKHPTLKIHEIRKTLLIPIYSHGITQTLHDSMYHVQQDALAIGPRCEKKGATRSLCDFCWYINGQRREETTKHILFDCPHAASVLNAHRAFILATALPPGVANVQSMDRASFIKKNSRRIVFGSTIREDQMYHAPPSVLAHFTAAVHQTAIERRKRNSIQGIGNPCPTLIL